MGRVCISVRFKFRAMIRNMIMSRARIRGWFRVLVRIRARFRVMVGIRARFRVIWFTLRSGLGLYGLH